MGKAQRYFVSPDEPDTQPPPQNKSFKPKKLGRETKPEVLTVVSSSKIKRKWRKDSKPAGVLPGGANKNKPKTKNRKKIPLEQMSYDDKIKAAREEPDPFPGKPEIPKASLDRHSRGKGLTKNVNKFIKTDIKRSKIIQRDNKVKDGLEKAARSEILLTNDSGAVEVGEGEHTLQLKQIDVRKKVDISSATKGFHLNLDQFGPYKLNYTPNGRYLVLGGRKGHIAAFDWVTKGLMCEMGVNESVHDVVWLHNENMFAVAQKEWTYIYDRQGIEIHCLKKMDRVASLDFLPYHFLLVGGHETGFLSWVDVSIGKVISQFNTRHGALNILTTNPANAVVHCGHQNGTVTLWAPTVKKPLVSMLAHGCPVSAISVDSIGRLMATSGRDGSLRIWDLRNSFAPLTSVKVGAATSLAFSQRGLLALATANQSLIFSEVGHKQKPFLKHVTHSHVSSLKFCPFEDILGVGTERGFDSVIVPGAGEPNYDAYERNPFQTKTQRRETEVKALLEKIQPELITLDNNILGEIDTETVEDSLDKKPKHIKKADIHLSHRKKRKNAKLPKIKEGLRSELSLRLGKEQGNQDKASNMNKNTVELAPDDPLSRFVKKKK